MPLDPSIRAPKMIAIDMDGTLIHPDGHISPRNITALSAARSAGARIVIATGRRHSYAMKVLRTVPLAAEDIVLSSNGTVARTVGGDLIFRRAMPLSTARWLCTQLGEFRNAFVLTFDLLGVDGEDMPGALVLEERGHLHGSIAAWMESNAAYIREVCPIEDALTAAPSDDALLPIQAMLCGTVERMARAEALLGQSDRAVVDLYRTEYPNRDLCILDILPAGCSKGSGLELLLHREGLAANDLMSIGDNWNDLPMLELAAFPVLMANAPPALRLLAEQRGWRITGSHGDDGVACAIEQQLLDQRKREQTRPMVA